MLDISSLPKASPILVFGDIILDKYWFGETNKISPEAPVPILNYSNEKLSPGGAGNVACNIASLGVNSILIGIVGDDHDSQLLASCLESERIKYSPLKSKEFETITKLRILNKSQQIVRIDFESDKQPIDHEELINRFYANIDHSSLLVLSDYGKGVLTDEVIVSSIMEAKKQNKKILVDPKGRNYKKYSGATVITPNLMEFEQVVGKCYSDEDIILRGESLRNDLAIEYLLITLGSRGMVLLDGKNVEWISATAKKVFDVSGAGDTVIATLASFLAAGEEIIPSLHIANEAAGIVVEKIGTSSINPKELSVFSGIENSIKLSNDESELFKIIKEYKSLGKKIVMTNGCFDLIHRGHIKYLEEAKALGDILLVALNSDSSVKRLKGNSRPINKAEDRAAVLAGLSSIDHIIVFEEDTPLNLVKKLLPDILAKGGDYELDQIIGAKEVKDNGGEVIIIDFLEGFSASSIIHKINNHKKSQ